MQLASRIDFNVILLRHCVRQSHTSSNTFSRIDCRMDVDSIKPIQTQIQVQGKILAQMFNVSLDDIQAAMGK